MDASGEPTFDSLAASAAFYFEQTKPMIPLYIHLILSALFPIVTGSFASLSRPSSAAKPSKEAKKARGEDDDGEDEEDEAEKNMEGLSAKDAIMLPVTAGAVLGGLYWLIRKYGADPINLILGWYFSGVGIFSVGKILNDAAEFVLSVVFPMYFTHKGKLWKVDGTKRKAITNGADQHARTSPLPGVLGLIPLPRAVADGLWYLRSIPKQKYAVVMYIKGALEANGPVTVLNIVAAFASLGAIAYNHFIAKPWWLTNLQGFAVSYTALQVMSPTTFATGSLILSGLFFYDIWAVFFTPLMVTVAKNLDQPIKLLFPRPDQPGPEGQPPTKGYSMLGLGDIVLPGLMIGLALRFDLHMYYLKKQKTSTKVGDHGESEKVVTKAEYNHVTGHWGSRLWTIGLKRSFLPASVDSAAFPKPYFVASLVGYVIGMIATLVVMSVWQHAQPALLYLVPGVLTSIWSTALVRGEVKQMWSYTEDVSGEAAENDEDEKKSKTTDEKKDGSSEKKESHESWWDYLKYEVIGLSRSRESDSKKKPSKSENEDKAGKNDADILDAKAAKDPDSIVAFSIRRIGPSSKKSKDTKASEVSNGDKADQKHGTVSRSSSSSEDVVLVSKDAETAPESGPSRRTRSKKA